MLIDLFSGDDIDGDSENKNKGLLQLEQKSRNFYKPSSPKDPIGLVGLKNQGATCYLNALLQVMFMTPELREGLYALDPTELGLLNEEEYEVQNLEKAKLGEKDIDENLLETLLAIGYSENKAKKALITTKSSSIDAAIEFLLTISDEEVSQGQDSEDHEQKKKLRKPRYIPLELQRIFAELQCLNQSEVSTEDLTTKGFQWQGLDGRVQHDAHELNRLLIDSLERSLKKTSGERLCSSLYAGLVVNQILCSRCGGLSEREESFYDLNLQVLDCDDAAKALHNYCRVEVLDGESAYQCDSCRGKTKAYRCSKIRKLPEILTLTANRFRIDKTTNWQRVKVTASSEYPFILDMNQFVYDYDLSAGKELQHVDSEDLISSKSSEMLWIKDIREKAKDFILQCLSDRASKLDGFKIMDEHVSAFRQLLAPSERLYGEAREDYRYGLHAIIIHRGSAYSGHYFAYIRDNLQEAFVPQVSTDISASNALQSQEKCSAVRPTVIDLTDRLGDFIVSSDQKTVYIIDEGPLPILLKIFRDQEEKQRRNTKKRSQNGKEKPFYLSLSILSREFSSLAGDSWTKLYKASLGNLGSFLSNCGDIFVEVGDGQLAIRCDRVLNVISKSSYQAMFENKSRDVPACSIGNRLTPSNSEYSEEELDAKVARELQESFDSELVAGRHESNNQETAEWQVSGSKRAMKRGKKDQQSTTHKNVINASTGEIAKDQENPNQDLLDALIEDLLRGSMGLFLEFNDSQITPIRYDRLENSFKGVDSAYMLVYRRIRTDSGFFPTEVSPPTPPQHWLERVRQQNHNLERERQLYKENVDKITLRVFLKKAVVYNPPLFLLTQDSPGITVEIDQRATVREVAELVLNEMLVEARNPAGWLLAKLDKLSVGSLVAYYASSPADACESANIHFAHGDALLMWEASDCDVICGEWSRPVVLNCHVIDVETPTERQPLKPLDNKGDNPWPKARMSTRNQLQFNDATLTVDSPSSHALAGNMSLLDACMSIAQRLGLDPLQIQIRAKFNKGASSKSSASKNKGKADEDKLCLVFDRCSIYLHEFPPLAPGIAAGEETPLSELWFIRDLYIENTNSGWLGAGSLSEYFLVQEKEMLQLSVEIDSSLVKALRAAAQEKEKGSVSEVLSPSGLVLSNIPDTVDLKVPKSLSVAETKRRVLSQLNLPERLINLEDCRLRKGDRPGEDLVVNEQATLLESKVGMGKGYTSRLTLEMGSVVGIPESIVINIALVQGNSGDTLYSLADAGTRVVECTETIPFAATIKELRDLAGVKLLGLPPNWSSHDSDEATLLQFCQSQSSGACEFACSSFRGRRLRTTAWTGEPSSLLFELDKKNLPLTVKQSGLVSGSLLLFEEGRLPVRGFAAIPVFAWLGSRANESQSRFEAHCGDNLTERIEQAYKLRQNCAFPIGEVSLSRDSSTLQDLYSAAHALLCERREKLSEQLTQSDIAVSGQGRMQEWVDMLLSPEPLPVERLLLRELRPELLPGARLWLHDIDGAPPGCSSGGGAQLIKRLGQRIQRGVIIELLSSTQKSNLPTSGSFTVWLQRLLNPDNCSAGEAVMSPLWPPLQVTVAGGVAPTMGHLVRPMASLFADIDFEDVVVFRYQHSKLAWTEVNAESQGRAKKKSSGNICQPPLNVREGDLFCIFKRSEVSGGVKGLEISTPADLYMQQLRAETLLNKSSGDQSNCMSFSDSKALHRPEYALSIRLDIDDDWEDDST